MPRPNATPAAKSRVIRVPKALASWLAMARVERNEFRRSFHLSQMSVRSCDMFYDNIVDLTATQGNNEFDFSAITPDRLLMIPNAYVGLGSNLGDRAGNLLLAVRGILEAGLEITRLSPIYETEAITDSRST